MYRLQDKITKKYIIFVMKYLYKILKFTPSELPRKDKKVSFFPPYIKLSLLRRSIRTWVPNVQHSVEGGGSEPPSCSL